jgi:hypothetical protein
VVLDFAASEQGTPDSFRSHQSRFKIGNHFGDIAKTQSHSRRAENCIDEQATAGRASVVVELDGGDASHRWMKRRRQSYSTFGLIACAFAEFFGQEDVRRFGTGFP